RGCGERRAPAGMLGIVLVRSVADGTCGRSRGCHQPAFEAGPAEVASLVDHVDLGGLSVALVVGVELTGERVHRQTDRVAEARAEDEGLRRDGRLRSRLRRRGALDVQPEDLPGLIQGTVVGNGPRRIEVRTETDVGAEGTGLRALDRIGSDEELRVPAVGHTVVAHADVEAAVHAEDDRTAAPRRLLHGWLERGRDRAEILPRTRTVLAVDPHVLVHALIGRGELY